MDEFRQRACARGVPCALQHYLYVTYGTHLVEGLPKHECVKAFRYWVDNSRFDTSACLTKEHLTCPMLWCRDTFKDRLETMNHVPTCCWLANTWYWCPSCSRPETFLDCGGSGRQVPLQRKESKLRRAMAFFKQFGRRTSVKGKITWSLPSVKAWEMADTSRYAIEDVKAPISINSTTEMDCNVNMHEMVGSVSKDWSRWHEMSSRLSHAVQHELPDYKHPFEAPSPYAELTGSRSQQKITPRSLHEIYDPSAPVAELPSRLSHIVHFELPQPEERQTIGDLPSRIEQPARSMHTVLDENFLPGKKQGLNRSLPVAMGNEHAGRHSPGSDVGGSGFRSSIDISPISNFSPSSPQTDSLSSKGQTILVSELSPVSPRSLNSVLSPPKPTCYLPPQRQLPWTETIISAQNLGKSLNSADDQPNVRTLSNNDVLPHAIHDALPTSGDVSTSAQPLIDELRDLVYVVNNEWLQRLAPHPEILTQCSSLPARALFELGIIAVKLCFEGTLSFTFFDVFALMHVACASTYMLHKDDESYPWDDVLSDVFAWKHALLENRESLLFMRVMDELLNPWESPTSSSHMPLSDGRTPCSVLETLRNGPIVQSCAMLLGDLDYERVLERNRPLLPAHFTFYAQSKRANIERMLDQIIRPLQRRGGMNAFRDIITNIEFHLRSGLLRDPWEVEVALLSIGRKYSQSPLLYKKYHEAIGTLCDNAMEQLGSNWRYPYYATAVERALAISLEMDKLQRWGSPHVTAWPSVSVLSVVRPTYAASESATAVAAAGYSPSTDGSPVSTESASSMQTSQASDHESTLTSPTTVCTDSTFAMSVPASPIPKLHEARCDECNTIYTGVSCGTNLQRHLRYDKPHCKVATFECFESGCGRKFGRPDNRNQHFQIAHPSNAALQLRRRGAMKRRREDKDEGGRGIVTRLLA